MDDCRFGEISLISKWCEIIDAGFDFSFMCSMLRSNMWWLLGKKNELLRFIGCFIFKMAPKFYIIFFEWKFNKFKILRK